MVLIFAKLHTKEKIAVETITSMIPHIQRYLNDTKGGQWLTVDHLKPLEFFTFESTNIYKGFEPTKDRYFDVESITEKTNNHINT